MRWMIKNSMGDRKIRSIRFINKICRKIEGKVGIKENM